MPETRPPISVLVVCDGNICRSPAAEFALSRALPHARVESAGQRTRNGSPICMLVRDHIAADGGEFADRFRSRRIDEVQVGDFDLVLTATLALRSDIARANPQLIDQIFTMREIELLLHAPRVAGGSDMSTDSLVDALNQARGSLPQDPASRRRWGRPPIEPLDIPDEHAARTRLHRLTVDTALQVGAAIGAALATRLTDSVGEPPS